MPRPARRDVIIAGGLYHVYARGNDRMTLFRESADYEFYLDNLNDLRTPYGVLLYHYVLMPNHIHFLLQPTTDDISAFMKTLQIRFAKYFCRKYEFVGHVWQGRFKNRIIDSDAYMFVCGNYIEMNPVRAGMVADPAEWPYSSYRFYAYGEPDSLVETDPLYLDFGRTPEERQGTYRCLIDQTRATSVPKVSGTV